jgi:dienelactone hydrolase
MKRILFLVMLSVLLVGPAHASDVEKSWDKATVFVPGKWFPTSVDRISVSQPMPVVIYLHGCVGITRDHDGMWAEYLTSQGFVVVMPDSMARSNRPLNCDGQSRRGNLWPQAHEYRLQEIARALDQVMSSTWADKKNVFLMGHSEGGIAVARSQHNEFAGKIILAWGCTSSKPEFDGIFAPKHVPVLAVAYTDDEWRKGTHNEGTCGAKAQGRDNFRAVDLPGRWHATAGDVQARRSVREFLNTFRTK